MGWKIADWKLGTRDRGLLAVLVRCRRLGDAARRPAVLGHGRDKKARGPTASGDAVTQGGNDLVEGNALKAVVSVED